MRGTARRRSCGAVASLAALQALLPLVGAGDALPRMAVVVVAVAGGAAVVSALLSARGGAEGGALGRALDGALAGVGGALVGGACVVAGSVSGEAVLGVLPGARARADLAALWHAGRVDIGTYAPPAPLSAGLLLILCTAALGVAVSVDVLAVGLRRPALAGLPLLGVLVVPAAIAPHGIGAPRFTVAALGYLVLLASDAPARVGGWLGREVPASATPRGASGGRLPGAPATSGLAAAGVLLALVVPAALPALHRQAFGSGGGDGASSGPAAVSVADPLVTVRQRLLDRSPRELLRYRTTGAADYLRLTALDRFDGQEWSQATLRAGADHRVRRGLPPVPGLAADVDSREVRVAVHIGPSLLEHWLPLPYPATAVAVGGDWKYDEASRVVFSARDDTRRLEYTATALQLRPTPAQLDAATLTGATAVDGSVTGDPEAERIGLVPSELAALALQVTGNGSRYQQALRLQRWFHDGFRYDLSVRPGNGLSAIQRLLQTRRGYCEQFASAMALFARIAGIPARVAIGFTPGAEVGGGERVVTTHDAHSWPELWFPGTGWLRFEPTPRGDGQAEPPPWTREGRTSTAPAPRPTAAAPRTTSAPDDPTTRRSSARGSRLAPDAPAPVTRRRHGQPLWPLLVVLLAVPGLLRLGLRRRRLAAASEAGARGAHAAWAELMGTTADLGWRPDPTDTPRSAARRLAERTGPAGAGDLEALAVAEEQARYARAATASDLRPALVAALPLLHRAAPRWRRVVARLLPASLMRVVTRVSRPARRGGASSALPSARRRSGAAGAARPRGGAAEASRPRPGGRRRRPNRNRTGASSR